MHYLARTCSDAEGRYLLIIERYVACFRDGDTYCHVNYRGKFLSGAVSTVDLILLSTYLAV